MGCFNSNEELDRLGGQVQELGLVVHLVCAEQLARLVAQAAAWPDVGYAPIADAPSLSDDAPHQTFA